MVMMVKTKISKLVALVFLFIMSKTVGVNILIRSTLTHKLFKQQINQSRNIADTDPPVLVKVCRIDINDNIFACHA